MRTYEYTNFCKLLTLEGHDKVVIGFVGEEK